MAKISLQLATKDDLHQMLRWRNDPRLMQGFYQQSRSKHIITWEEHVKWFENRNQDWRTFIILYGSDKVGVVTIGQLDHWSPEVGYYVSYPRWGMGIGKEAVRQALAYIKKYGRDYAHATVLKNNERSVRLLKSLGFTELGDARPDEIWMQKKL